MMFLPEMRWSGETNQDSRRSSRFKISDMNLFGGSVEHRDDRAQADRRLQRRLATDRAGARSEAAPVRRKNNTKTSIKLCFSTIPTGMSRFAISSNGTAVLA
jgi:hypothetical protein